MKIYTVFTESHYPMFKDYFLKTFPFDPEAELVIKFKPQLCPSSEFQSEGWKDTMMYKVDCFIDACAETKENECFIFLDPDIQFFGPFVRDMIKEVEGFDVAFQNDFGGGVNTGCFIMRNVAPVRYFLSSVKQNLKGFNEEQECFNFLIRNFNQYPSIKFKGKFLPIKYWTYGEVAIKTTGKAWEGHEDFDIPQDIILHHANWSVPFTNKPKIMDKVREKYNAFRNI